uniref:Reverse transcriptase Ty1/copia-type domain-containing protein n=1 Tax=Amphimedon queenslandica TaxID=400682 RepID=A0A1X7SKT4_AMPQE
MALSTSEAEYATLTSAAEEAIWLRRLIAGVSKKPAKAMVIQKDNQEHVKEGMIRVEYCKTEDVLADIFTKGLFGERFKILRNLNGMIELDTSTLYCTPIN